MTSVRVVCFRLLVVLVLGLGASACATPAPVVRFHPVGQDPAWVSGMAVTSLERRGVRVATAFAHQSDDLAAFRVEVHNGSDRTLLVDPVHTRYVHCGRSSRRSGSDLVCSGPHAVPNPESQLLALDKARSVERARKQTDDNIQGSLLLLSVVADVSEVASGKRVSSSAAAEQVDRWHASNATHRANLSALEVARQMWATEALRKTTLLPGSTVAGMVYVPLDQTAESMILKLWIDEIRFTFSYRQEVFEPR